LQAQRTYEDLVKMLGESLVHLYPAEELIAGDFSISSYELRGQRIETIDHMARVGKGVYITPVAGMRKFMPSRDKWLSNSLLMKTGDTINIDDWLQKLVGMSYSRQAMVTAPGEFALRGGILDIYPLHMDDPVRIELFDTEIDSIRTFSADDQRSTGKLKEILILPASEFVWSQEDMKFIAQRLEKELSKSLKKFKDADAKERLTLSMKNDIDFMEAGSVPENILKYASFERNSFFSINTLT